VGINGARDYVSMLSGMSVHLSSMADMLRYGTIPSAMPNLRGLLTSILGPLLPHRVVQFAIFACSAAILALAARQKTSLSIAILVASLVSYHFLCHDASILLLPVAAALSSSSLRNGIIGLLLLLTPFSTVSPGYGYLSAIPALMLLFLLRSETDGPKELQSCLN
jgi:hypothetical protein